MARTSKAKTKPGLSKKQQARNSKFYRIRFLNLISIILHFYDTYMYPKIKNK